MTHYNWELRKNGRVDGYAWFTMSREVEVKNIQMTATVPEDLQLSIGKIGNTSESTNLAKSTGFLTVSNGVVEEPGTDDFNWSNSADISAYYAFGKLIPASSTTGENIFFTPDANGVGKTVKLDGKFYQAATAKTATADAGSGTYAADSHVYSSDSERSKWSSSGTSYVKATAWNKTNSDGYYIDIPVWLRTSSAEAEISVSAYVVDKIKAGEVIKEDLTNAGSGTAAGEMLYKAVRVAVLDKDGKQITYGGDTFGLVNVVDGQGSGTYPYYTGSSIIDYYNRGAASDTSIGGSGAVASVSNDAATYGTPAVDNGTKFAKLTGGTGVDYGQAQKFIIRVWLEGEDPDCWNQTAGQDWSINLMFHNETTK